MGEREIGGERLLEIVRVYVRHTHKYRGNPCARVRMCGLKGRLSSAKGKGNLYIGNFVHVSDNTDCQMQLAAGNGIKCKYGTVLYGFTATELMAYQVPALVRILLESYPDC